MCGRIRSEIHFHYNVVMGLLLSRPIALTHFKILWEQQIEPGLFGEMAHSTVRAGRYKMNLEYLVMTKIFEALQRMMGVSKRTQEDFHLQEEGVNIIVPIVPMRCH